MIKLEVKKTQVPIEEHYRLPENPDDGCDTLSCYSKTATVTDPDKRRAICDADGCIQPTTY